MKIEATSDNDLDHADMARFIIDMLHRQMLHHGLWYAEARHQLGGEKALELLESATRKSLSIQLKHYADLLGFTIRDGVPSPLLDLSSEQLLGLKERVAKNWLVTDGVWFQAIEQAEGMNDAKRINDSCWAQFSPVEAKMIKSFLNLPDKPGLAGLKKALGYRLYASINEQSIVEETPTSFIFQMNKCRVQEARKRKKLADYPCKSAGLVEYTYFARTIDTRISTTCIGCPPDHHPEEWYCAWRFHIDQSEGEQKSNES